MLRNLQGNILKGHGREHTWNIFFQFGTDPLASKRALREIANYHVTDALTQLLTTEAFKASKKDPKFDGGTFAAAFLSQTGYTSLGIPFNTPAGNSVFTTGMKTSTAVQDPPIANWETPFSKQIDGMILVGDADQERGETIVSEICALLEAADATIHHIQVGGAVKNKVGKGIEHFGYVDGRSQPLLLTEDIDDEINEAGNAHWDPAFPLASALVPDPGLIHPLAFGSFFIFRKLEQDVAGFKSREQELATALGLHGEDRERAGALVVGRFEDGTPVTMSDEAKGKEPPNDFSYQGSDAAASRCPFHAHIRKVNPRHPAPLPPPAVPLNQGERAHIMPRRGIPFTEVDRVHPNDLPDVKTQAEFIEKVLPLLPTGGIGLLFMAYNSKLDDQFVFTQNTWANNPTFPNAGTGLDGVIGLPHSAPGGQTYAKEWDNPASPTAPFDFNGFVHMKGGEYFFAPSLLFLRTL